MAFEPGLVAFRRSHPGAPLYVVAPFWAISSSASGSPTRASSTRETSTSGCWRYLDRRDLDALGLVGRAARDG